MLEGRVGLRHITGNATQELLCGAPHNVWLRTGHFNLVFTYAKNILTI